jgi:hypothetical protein
MHIHVGRHSCRCIPACAWLRESRTAAQIAWFGWPGFNAYMHMRVSMNVRELRYGAQPGARRLACATVCMAMQFHVVAHLPECCVSVIALIVLNQALTKRVG